MSSYFSIVQYCPDPVTNERVNVGVLVFGDGRTRSHFLQRWHRVRQFSGKDVDFLRELAHDASKFDEKTIRRISGKWINTVQLTPPSGSLLPPDKLLIDTAARFLVDPPDVEKAYRHKSDAVRLVRHRLRDSLTSRLGGVGRLLVKPHYRLQGEQGPHEFDVSVANGQPYLLAQALSFELPEGKKLDKEVNATAWAVEDVKRVHKQLPITIIAIPPREEQNETYRRAVGTFRYLGTPVVTESEVPKWADRVAQEVPEPGGLRH